MPSIGYMEFLLPGLVAMAMLQGAFENGAYSISHAKIIGNIVHQLLPPVTSLALTTGYLGAALLRASIIAVAVLVIGQFFALTMIHSPLWTVIMIVISAVSCGAVGLIIGIWADRFDQIALLQNFVFSPLLLLSGIFYSIHSLPEFWAQLSYYNPFFYIVDGIRYGILGASDAAIGQSFLISVVLMLMSCITAWQMLAHGYKIKS